MGTVTAQIKLADIKRLMLDGTCQYYMCHNVAYLMDSVFENTFPNYRRWVSDSVDGANISTGSAPYHFLCDNNTTNIDTQVVGCIHNFMMQIEPGIDDTFFYDTGYLYRHAMLAFLKEPSRPDWTARGLRIDTLGKILKHFPDATMDITLHV
jgi:hypothetical protein